jgi:hypothetical protein
MSLALNECLISPRGLAFDELLKKPKQVWGFKNLHQPMHMWHRRPRRWLFKILYAHVVPAAPLGSFKLPMHLWHRRPRRWLFKILHAHVAPTDNGDEPLKSSINMWHSSGVPTSQCLGSLGLKCPRLCGFKTSMHMWHSRPRLWPLSLFL